MLDVHLKVDTGMHRLGVPPAIAWHSRGEFATAASCVLPACARTLPPLKIQLLTTSHGSRLQLSTK